LQNPVHNRLVTRGFLIVAMVSFVPGCEIVPIVGSALAQDGPPRQYLPEIQERQRFSDIVCFGTILSTQLTTAVVLGARERSEWLAIAHIDRVIKGDLQGRIIQFKYSWDLALPPGDYFGPPLAHFESGIRYVLFLKSDGADLQVAIPTYQMEIQIAAEPPKMQVAESDPGLALATELVFAVQPASQPEAMATHYFSWAEELIGKRSIAILRIK
jgi:hypothetical protein